MVHFTREVWIQISCAKIDFKLPILISVMIVQFQSVPHKAKQGR